MARRIHGVSMHADGELQKELRQLPGKGGRLATAPGFLRRLSHVPDAILVSVTGFRGSSWAWPYRRYMLILSGAIDAGPTGGIEHCFELFSFSGFLKPHSRPYSPHESI